MQEMNWNGMKWKKAQLRSVLATRDKVHGCGDDGALPTGLLLGLRRNETSTACFQLLRKSILKSNLELVATGLIVIWQYLLRGPPCSTKIGLTVLCLWSLCVFHQKRQPSHDPKVLIESPIWNAAMALVNVVELHRPLHVTKCYKMCYIDDIDMMAMVVFSNKVPVVFSRKRGSNHGEVRGTANQLDDMLEPRLIAAQALHIQGNNKYAVKWPV